MHNAHPDMSPEHGLRGVVVNVRGPDPAEQVQPPHRIEALPPPPGHVGRYSFKYFSLRKFLFMKPQVTNVSTHICPCLSRTDSPTTGVSSITLSRFSANPTMFSGMWILLTSSTILCNSPIITITMDTLIAPILRLSPFFL